MHLKYIQQLICKVPLLATVDDQLNPFMTVAVSYSNQYIDLRGKSMDWFLYDNGLRHEKVKLLKFCCVIDLSTLKLSSCVSLVPCVFTPKIEDLTNFKSF